MVDEQNDNSNIVPPDSDTPYLSAIINRFGTDTDEPSVRGLGYSPDNGVHFYVTDTIWGRKYRQEDADRLYPFLKRYFGASSSGSGGPVASSIAWADVIGKPALVTKDELEQRFDTFTPVISSIDWSRITNKPDLVTDDELDKRLANFKPSSSSGDTLQSSQTISLSGSAMSIDIDKGKISFNGEMADPAGVEHKQELQAAVSQAQGTLDQANENVIIASNAVSALQSEGPATNQSATPLSDWSGFQNVCPYPDSYYDLNFTTPVPDGADDATFTIDVQQWINQAENSITVALLGDDKATKTIDNQINQSSQRQKIILKTSKGNLIKGIHFRGSNIFITGVDVSATWTTKGYTSEEMSSASTALSEAQVAVSSANSALSAAQSEYDNYKVKQVSYTFDADKTGLSYTADGKITRLLSIPKKEENNLNLNIDKSNVSSNKKPSEYSDGIFYEKKMAASIGIHRLDYAKPAQSGTWGILTTKSLDGTVRQMFELFDGNLPLTFVRTGSKDKWKDWSGITNWE